MIYETLSKLYTKKLKNYIDNLLHYAGIKVEPNKLIGFVLSFSFLLSLAVAANLKGFFDISFLASMLITFIAAQLAVFFFLIIRIDIKSNLVEEVLPDALQLMASNLRAGLTTERAILLSSRPEFGPLQKEIDQVGKKLAVGVELADALSAMSERIKSKILDKTLLLIKSGLESGGSLAPLLEQTAENLREQQLVRKRIRANILMYIIFIFIAISLGSPLLFGLSSFLVQVLAKNIASIEIPPEATTTIDLPFNITQVAVTENFIMVYIITSLITNSFMGALILGLIGKGKEREGIKYIPFILIISLTVFIVTRLILKNVFATLFGL